MINQPNYQLEENFSPTIQGQYFVQNTPPLVPYFIQNSQQPQSFNNLPNVVNNNTHNSKYNHNLTVNTANLQNNTLQNFSPVQIQTPQQIMLTPSFCLDVHNCAENPKDVKLEEDGDIVHPSEQCTLMLQKRSHSLVKMEEDEYDDDFEEEYEFERNLYTQQQQQQHQHQQHQQQQQQQQNYQQQLQYQQQYIPALQQQQQQQQQFQYIQQQQIIQQQQQQQAHSPYKKLNSNSNIKINGNTNNLNNTNNLILQNNISQTENQSWVLSYKNNKLVLNLFLERNQNLKCLQQNNHNNIIENPEQQQQELQSYYLNMEQSLKNLFQKKSNDEQLCIKLPKIYQNDNIAEIELQQQQSYPQQPMLKKEESVQSLKNTSKFHNRNKLFINGLIRFFTRDNIQKLCMPDRLQDAVFDVMDKARLSGRLLNAKKVLKTDLFNHSHYNLLFQKLNEKTLIYLKKNKKDVTLHKQIFDLDLEDPQLLINQQKLEHVGQINFLKRCVYEIIIIHLKQQILGNGILDDQREYEIRAFNGIQQMVEGNVIQRF